MQTTRLVGILTVLMACAFFGLAGAAPAQDESGGDWVAEPEAPAADPWVQDDPSGIERQDTPFEPAPQGYDATYGGPQVNWMFGPATVDVGGIAELELPAGYLFAGAKDAAKIMEAAGNPLSGNELAIVRPTSDEWPWFVVFTFDDIGYVKDDDKDALDADKLFKAIEEGTLAANVEREKMGTSPIYLIGWDVEPHYDEDTQHLEWCIRGKADEELLLNHNIRVLGRKGVTSVVLVADPDIIGEALPQVRTIVAGYTYKEGSRYGDFKRGDTVAKAGLAALVAGGAGAVLLKTGLLQKFWKLLVVGAVAGVAGLKGLWARLTGRRQDG